MFVGEKQIAVNQQYEILATIMQNAFGGKKNGVSPGETPVIPQTAAEARELFKSMGLGMAV